MIAAFEGAQMSGAEFMRRVNPRMDSVCEKGETSEKSPPEPMGPAAYHGLAGELVALIDPHTEAAREAVLMQFLAAFGNAIGRGPYYRVEADRHGSNIFVVLVGDTSKGRKGTSWRRIRSVFAVADPVWDEHCIASGLSSGEGLIWLVRDPITTRQPIKQKGRVVDYEDVESDPGVVDKRAVVIEEEFASTLRVMARQGNTLSPVIRQAWDRGDLRMLTKVNQARATDSLISIIGHVTAEELRRYLDRTEVGNGFANRFLFVCVRRSKVLPDGGEQVDLMPIGRQLAASLERARATREVIRSPAARDRWHAVYPELSEGRPGLCGAVAARGEAHATRLALLFALLDRSKVIELHHLEAALEVWRYADASAGYVFAGSIGDPVADEIVRALRAVAPNGLSRTDLSGLFGRHKDQASLGAALEQLAKRGLARCERIGTGGRPVEMWFAQ